MECSADSHCRWISDLRERERVCVYLEYTHWVLPRVYPKYLQILKFRMFNCTTSLHRSHCHSVANSPFWLGRSARWGQRPHRNRLARSYPWHHLVHNLHYLHCLHYLHYLHCLHYFHNNHYRYSLSVNRTPERLIFAHTAKSAQLSTLRIHLAN